MSRITLEEALAAFPPDSPWRETIATLMDDDLKVRQKAYDRIGRRKRMPLSEQEALAVLAAALSLDFPALEYDWNSSQKELLTLLWSHAYPAPIASARAAYASASDKGALLALFGATGTREGAEAFVECIAEHGWPETIYERVFTELRNLLDYSDILFPSLLASLLASSGGYFPSLADVLLEGLASRKLSARLLSPCAPELAGRISRGLQRAAICQQPTGVAWRFEEQYWYLRQHTAAALDLAGWLDRELFEPLLRQATRMPDPRLATLAAASLLRQGADVDDAALDAAAASHETRAILFEMLEALGHVDRFPRRWRTWAAFAAADMVQWLCFPTELGREPDYLEMMALFQHEGTEGKQALYVWRFRNEDDDKWHAGTSGIYTLEGQPRPLSGSETFSSFDAWEEATAEEHAMTVLDTLDNWRRHFEAENGGA